MNYDSLAGKTVLITGGTGSFGKNFTKHILANSKLKKLIVFSRDELKQSEIQAEITDERLRFFLGDVRDLQRLQRAFDGVHIVVHAAALKQVPALEFNPFEAVKTNIIGSQNVIEAALDQGVEKVILVSTDKAAMPANLYGSTKLCAEKLFIAGNAYSDGKTKFSVVRYGNVVGSRGSIIEKLIKHEGSHTVTITDERMTRFWIDLEKASSIVLFGLEHMEGGEVFIPKAATMKLTDLFDIVVPEAKRTVIGIRPGEKLHEILLTKEEARHAIEFRDYFVILPEHASEDVVKAMKKYEREGSVLPKDFSFESDGTENEMSREELLRIVEGIRNPL